MYRAELRLTLNSPRATCTSRCFLCSRLAALSSVIPEMQRDIVDVKGWTTAADSCISSRVRSRPTQRAVHEPDRLPGGGHRRSLVALLGAVACLRRR